MSGYKFVIFDMDGLMFETGRLAYEAYLRSAQHYDYEMTHNVYYLLTGRTNHDIIESMKELYGTQYDVTSWRALMVEEKANILEEQKRVYKKEGLVELLEYLHTQRIPCAVASSSKREIVERYLEVEELTGQFDYILAGDEVHQGKPSPEIFLNCCKKAGVSAQDTLVLEDSIVGIEAALAGNMHCCLIHDDITDMPIRHAGIPLKKDLRVIPKENVNPTYQKDSLLDVIEILTS
ncbi:HAD family hydrolase [Amedibacillus sp. YH-ame6]